MALRFLRADSSELRGEGIEFRVADEPGKIHEILSLEVCLLLPVGLQARPGGPVAHVKVEPLAGQTIHLIAMFS